MTAETQSPAESRTTPTAASPRRGRILTAETRARQERERQIEVTAEERYARARAEGYIAGRDAAAAEAIEMLAELRVQSAQWAKSVEAEMVEAVLRAVSKVIGEIDEIELVQRVSAAALSELRDVGRVALHVSPEDEAAVRRDIAVLEQAFPSVEIADVVADPQVGRGGAILRSAIGAIDARIETQLDGLRRALTTAFAPDDDDDI